MGVARRNYRNAYEVTEDGGLPNTASDCQFYNASVSAAESVLPFPYEMSFALASIIISRL